MNRMTLIGRSLRFHWRLHASVAAGVAVATAALVGALLVGDSVSGSLNRFALQRLGSTEFALHLRNRYVASRLAEEVGLRAYCLSAPILMLPGMAVNGEGGPQANQVQVLGVDDRFENFGGFAPPPAGQADVNEKLARRLGLQAGDELVVRIARPSLLPREAPLSSRKERPFVRVALTVRQVVSDAQLGRFGLAAEQSSPDNLFVPLGWLQEKAGLPGKANVLLAAGKERDSLYVDRLNYALGAFWQLTDSGLSLREVQTTGLKQLESDRVFLEPEVAAITGRWAGAAGSFAYLVNSLSVSNAPGRMTPYSFVVACAPSADKRLGPVPADMGDDEILINQWLADQLAAKPGDTLMMSYYELSISSDLNEQVRPFRVRAVIGMEEAARERLLMPAFPGLTDVESCADWNIGLPMNEDWLKDKPNEAYWNTYKATPKAFITLAAGQRLWGNRFGNLTAIRFLEDESGGPTPEVVADLMDPSKLGLYFQPVRAEALKAVEEALDFGGLFLGMSFLVVVAALLLTALLFVLGVEQRAPQTGLLLALGYTPRAIQGLLLGEGLGIALAGSAAGAMLGAGYARLLLWGLASLWPDAVAGAVVTYHGDSSSLLTGAVAGVLCAMAAMALALRRQMRHPVRELLSGDLSYASPVPGVRPGRVALMLALAATAGAVGIVAVALRGGGAVEAFFGAGALLLAAFFGYGRFVLMRLAASRRDENLSISALGLRNAGRRPGRSLAVAGLLAAGSFMVLAVASMQEDVAARAQQRKSGTGGFAWFGQTTLGVSREAIQTELGSASSLDGVVLVKRLDGDDASCFNLNRARTPILLGVDAAAFARLGAFAGTETWALLDRPRADGAVPALAGDADTALWGLKKRAEGRAGDDIEYRDEQGRPFTVRLVGKLPMRLSVFQGAVLVSERAFNEKFPSEEGYRVLLVDAPRDRAEAVAKRLAHEFERLGLDLEPTTRRLEDFGSVQLAYLRMFLALGGLGLLIGSAGMGIVVVRNVLERRGELAALGALGFNRAAVRRLVRIEHLLLLAFGLAGGIASASLAMLPSLLSPAVQIPWPALGGLVGALAILGTGWILAAVAWATRGTLREALRDE